MSEKLDGIRAYWDGGTMYSRHGKEIRTPRWFVEGLPGVPLDGELWAGRGSQQQLAALVNSGEEGNALWKGVKYCVFDLPSSEKEYEARMRELSQMGLPRHVKPVEAIECEGPAHLESFLESIVAEDGEGVVAREPGSLYEPNRTTSMLKVKVGLAAR